MKEEEEEGEGDPRGGEGGGEVAASTASKDGNASKPPKQMLSDWKRRLRRSASYAGSLKLVATRACSPEFERRERKLIYTQGVFKYAERDRRKRNFGTFENCM
jgi:hypothetical protein